ncbi:monovalent cation/H(+) antiporter subunit G [Microbulbifer sp.]|uniref:monovalent cation/H(+) antiporter subunit G n=1 Tax=Microbulbifer sp. TaxID=1908541 RepID=UPI003F3511C1
MIENAVAAISGVSLALGCLLMLSGALGLLRFPDFYTRMHAAGITDTLASFLIICGLMAMAGWSLALAKLGMILLFIFFTGPTASHALARAAQQGRPALAVDGQADAGVVEEVGSAAVEVEPDSGRI